QGSLSNFAGGILILTLKPFNVGDYVEIDGTGGSVNGVSIMTTTLKTPDNRTIFLPNGKVAGANITNFTIEPTRRWDKVFGIGYGDDFDKAKSIIMKFIESDDRFLKDPAPFVRVGNLGDSSVDITVRAWVNTPDYWNVNWDMIENVKKEFDKQGISIPFPQRDVHLYNQK
ncbi:MAG: small conductance mechanosensitive channel, partial [Roseivirga sp.]